MMEKHPITPQPICCGHTGESVWDEITAAGAGALETALYKWRCQ